MNCIVSKSRSSISKIRDREQVIRQLLPKISGILSQRGRFDLDYLGLVVHMDGHVTIAVCEIDLGIAALSVYWTIHGKIVKVFSAYILRSAGISDDPTFYRYWNGLVGVMSWRRGGWEDLIIADPAIVLPSDMIFFEGSQPELRWLQ